MKNQETFNFRDLHRDHKMASHYHDRAQFLKKVIFSSDLRVKIITVT